MVDDGYRSTRNSLSGRIFVAVREAANGLEKVWGEQASSSPGYRTALIESAVALNAAQAAFDLRQEVEKAAKWEIEVLYGVHNIRNHQVCMPVDPTAPRSDENVHLARAPTNPKEFQALAVQMAQILKADITPSTELDLERLLREAAGSGPSPYEQGEDPEFARDA